MIIRMGTDAFKVTVASPMTKCMGEYGPRFDTLGAITNIRIDGVEFCAREGLIDEFNIQAPHSPPGFDEAKPGESFMKIGVGELVRPDDSIYLFFHHYAVRKSAPVSIRRKKNELELKQMCRTGNGWAYDYRKLIRIEPEEKTVTISYLLENTGRHAFVAEQYNHNWFNPGGGAVDKSYMLEHQFKTSGEIPPGLRSSGKSIGITGKITKPVYFPSDSPSSSEKNSFILKHSSTGRSVSSRGDFDLARFAFYADTTAVCPETFFRAEIKTGCSASWSRQYKFGC